MACYGRRMCINLRSQQADFAALGEAHKKTHSYVFSSGMLFVVPSEMSTSTFAWTFALTDCDVSRFVWTSFETKQY